MATRWDDTVLMAYVDGELDQDTAQAVEASLPGDAEAQATVALFRRSAQAAAAAFDGTLRQPVPPRLEKALQPAKVVPFTARPRPPLARLWLPLAASLAGIAIGLGGGHAWWGRAEAPVVHLAGAGDAAAERFGAALRGALEHGADGQIIPYADGRITLLGPVDGRLRAPCRAFRHEPAIGPAAGGVACRGADGAWQTLTVTGP